ncbi:hypothetical protein TELCIR_21510, partial [Teladorsagia circumcincta]
ELKINMSDAVNSLYYIYDICSSDYSKSPYASIAAKICLRQDEIAKQSDCYQSTLEKEKCALRVIEIQEAINDIIIERKCFETKEKAAAPVARTDDPDEFHLDTKLPHCTDDQVCSSMRIDLLIECQPELAGNVSSE